ncbi:hypothetical protein Hdeb2414_s1208g00991891 [Helianthus debilis subsp. tardiflorus]
MFDCGQSLFFLLCCSHTTNKNNHIKIFVILVNIAVDWRYITSQSCYSYHHRRMNNRLHEITPADVDCRRVGWRRRRY